WTRWCVECSAAPATWTRAFASAATRYARRSRRRRRSAALEEHHRPADAHVLAHERIAPLLAREHGHGVHRGLILQELQHDPPVRADAHHPLQHAAVAVAREPPA